MIQAEAVMKKCIAESRKAKGFTGTNPLVGAAVVKNGNIVSTGIHEAFGGAHAEVNALDNAGVHAKGADLFVTLEPCSTSGKTPPCTDKIIESGIKRVYIGVTDVNPRHNGKGIYKLKEAGIKVFIGPAIKECALLTEDFIKSQTEGLPYVILKTAVSADGKISSFSGDSKWITCEVSRREVHKMRGESGAVLTGIGTVIADDPMLNDRRKNAGRQPLRAVMDAFCRISASSALIKSASEIPVSVYVGSGADKENIKRITDMGAEVLPVSSFGGSLDIREVLASLHRKNIMNVLVEAGGALSGAFFEGGFIDAFEEFVAPKIIGGDAAPGTFGGRGKELSAACEFCSWKIKKSGEDIRISARLKDYSSFAVAATLAFAEKGLCLRG